MNSEWTQKWKKVLIWFSSYFSLIAYAVVGGYVIVKSEDKELKKSAKVALVASLIWTAVSAFFAIFYSCMSMAGSVYGSTYEAYTIMKGIFDILKIIFYAVVILFVLFKKEESNEKVVVEENSDKTEE